MKNKILKFLKRCYCFLAAVLVFFCSAAVPSFAIDSTYNPSSRIMRPLFDYDFIEFTYIDGKRVVFNLKEAFYNNNFQDQAVSWTLFDTTNMESVTIVSYDTDFSKINYYQDGVLVEAPYYGCYYKFDFHDHDIVSVRIHVSETIYDYDVYQAAIGRYYDEFSFTRDDNYVPNSISFSKTGVYYYPVYSYDELGAVVGREFGVHDLSQSVGTASSSGWGVAVNGSELDECVSLLPSTFSRKLLYFSDFDLTTSVPSDATVFQMAVYYLPSDTSVNYKTYSDFYFPPYRFNNAVDFTGWIATAVSGILSLSFAPGITIGHLVAFMLGIAGFIAFLKFFAGG